MTQKILAYSLVPQDLLDALQGPFELMDFTGRSGLRRDPAFAKALSQAQGLLGAGLRVDRAMLDEAPQLEVVSTITVGYDLYDVAALSERGILLCNTPDVLTESVADTTLAMMLAVARRVVELANQVREGRWTQAVGPAEYGHDVYGKRLGIIGMGRIGAAVARRARLGFGMRIGYHSRSRHASVESMYDAEYQSLEALLATSDFVCVVVPLTAETEGMIGAGELALMKRSAYLINIARGAVIDEAALVSALEAGTIAGAGLDVFVREPLPMGSPLCRLPNVVALPHIGSATHETRYAMAALAVDNLRDALTGRRPRAVVNPEVRGWS
jgi:lactate dehydrogenase-like 2-hydroxyacid dehydrogenase